MQSKNDVLEMCLFPRCLILKLSFTKKQKKILNQFENLAQNERQWRDRNKKIKENVLNVLSLCKVPMIRHIRTVWNIASVLQALKSKDLHKYGLHLGAEGLKSNLCPLGNFCMRWILDILPYMPVPSAGSGGVGKAKKLTFYYSHGQFWNKSGFAIFESGKGKGWNLTLELPMYQLSKHQTRLEPFLDASTCQTTPSK